MKKPPLIGRSRLKEPLPTFTEQEVLTLIRVDYDSLENRDPECEEEVVSFVAHPGFSAIKYVDEWLKKQKPIKLYAHGRQVYPQWRIKRTVARRATI